MRSVLAPEDDGWKLDVAKSSVKLIDLDLKPLKLKHWAELDDKIWRHWADTKGTGRTSKQFLAVGGSPAAIIRDRTFGPGASELPVEAPPSPGGSIPDVNHATEELARMTAGGSGNSFSPVTQSTEFLPTPLVVPSPHAEEPVVADAKEVEAVPAAATAVAETESAAKTPRSAGASDAFADAPGDITPVATKGPAPVFTPAPAPPVKKSSSKRGSAQAPSDTAPSVKEKTPATETVALPAETPVTAVVADPEPAVINQESAPIETPEASPLESPESNYTADDTEASAQTNSGDSAEKQPERTPAAEVTPGEQAPATPIVATTPIKPETPQKSESQLPTPTQSPVKVARKKSSVFASLKTKISSKFDDRDKEKKSPVTSPKSPVTSPKSPVASPKSASSPKPEAKKAVGLHEEQPASPPKGKAVGTVAAGIAVYESKAKQVAEELHKADSVRRMSRDVPRERNVSVDLAKRKSLFEENPVALSTGPSPDTTMSSETAPDEPIATPAGEVTDPVIAVTDSTESERPLKPANIERTWEKASVADTEDVPETPRAVPPRVTREPQQDSIAPPAAVDDSPLTPGVPDGRLPGQAFVPGGLESEHDRRSDAPSPLDHEKMTLPSVGQSAGKLSNPDVPVPIATVPILTTPEIEHSTSPLRSKPSPDQVKRYSLTELPPLPDGTAGSRPVSRVSFDASREAVDTASINSSVDHRGFDTAPDTPQLDQDEFHGASQFSRGGMASTSTFGGPQQNMEYLSEEMRRKRVSLNESEAMSEAAWLGSPVHSTKVLEEPGE